MATSAVEPAQISLAIQFQTSFFVLHFPHSCGVNSFAVLYPPMPNLYSCHSWCRDHGWGLKLLESPLSGAAAPFSSLLLACCQSTGWIAVQWMLDCSIWYSCHASMECCSLSTLMSLRACCSNDTWEYSARSWSHWLACVSNAFPPPPVPPSLPRFPPISSKYTSPLSPVTTKRTFLTGFSFSGKTWILMYAVLFDPLTLVGGICQHHLTRPSTEAASQELSWH